MTIPSGKNRRNDYRCRFFFLKSSCIFFEIVQTLTPDADQVAKYLKMLTLIAARLQPALSML